MAPDIVVPIEVLGHPELVPTLCDGGPVKFSGDVAAHVDKRPYARQLIRAVQELLSKVRTPFDDVRAGRVLKVEEEGGSSQVGLHGVHKVACLIARRGVGSQEVVEAKLLLAVKGLVSPSSVVRVDVVGTLGSLDDDEVRCVKPSDVDAPLPRGDIDAAEVVVSYRTGIHPVPAAI